MACAYRPAFLPCVNYFGDIVANGAATASVFKWHDVPRYIQLIARFSRRLFVCLTYAILLFSELFVAIGTSALALSLLKS